MADQLEIRIEGLQEMIDRLKSMAEIVRSEALMGAVKAGAEVVRGDAARRAPVDIGTLQNSITIEELENTGDRASVAVGPDRSARSLRRLRSRKNSQKRSSFSVAMS